MKQILWLMMWGVPFSLAAEEMHHHHGSTATSEGISIAEGAMAPTGEGLSTAQRCELARRGVVMLDNGAWAVCGGKPATVPASVLPDAAVSHQHHEEH